MKKIINMILILLTLMLLTSCGDNKNQLVISTWGHNVDKLDEIVYTPFEEKYDVEIVLETGGTSERYNKFESNPNSTIDVIYLSQLYVKKAVENELFVSPDMSQFTNYNMLHNSTKDPFNGQSSPAYTVSRIGIVYLPNEVGFDITSFDDLWNEELKEAITIPSIETTFGPSVVYIASEHSGIDIHTDNGTAAFTALKSLRKNVVKTYTKSSEISNMFSSGEITVAIVPDYAWGSIKDRVPNAKWVEPSEGAHAIFSSANINKNSKNIDLAYKFIDFILSQEIQYKNAIAGIDAPVNKEVILSESEKNDTNYGNLNDYNSVDLAVVYSQYENWVTEWNKVFNQSH